MNLAQIDTNGKQIGALEVSDLIFDRPYNEALVHQLVVAYQANGRQATRAQKNRATVKHSTRKPWRQKGTGRARAGMTSSPIWRGGGRAFPATADEHFYQKINRKMVRAGLCAILSNLVRNDRMTAIDKIELETHKTKSFVQLVGQWVNEPVLIITDDLDQNLDLASRNTKHIAVLEVRYINPVALLSFERIVMTRAAVESLQAQWIK